MDRWPHSVPFDKGSEINNVITISTAVVILNGTFLSNVFVATTIKFRGK